MIAFYIGLGTVLILKGAAIAQAMHDVAQKLSHMKYGWLVIIGFMGASSPLSAISPCALLPAPDLTPVFRFHSCHFIPTHDGSHDNRDVVRLRVRHEGVLHRTRGVHIGRCHCICRFEIPVLQAASEVVRYE